jgi:glycine C-acetyltransferase
MKDEIKKHFSSILNQIEDEGLFKKERILTTPQQAKIGVKGGDTVLNMCANNYLGLSDNPEVIKAAKESYDKLGLRVIISTIYLRHSGNT